MSNAVQRVSDIIEGAKRFRACAGPERTLTGAQAFTAVLALEDEEAKQTAMQSILTGAAADPPVARELFNAAVLGYVTAQLLGEMEVTDD